MFSALKESVQHRLYSFAALRANVVSGITVGVVALPLSMALAIASGVAPQHGLYTAIVAGIVIALTGGSRVNVSGPTAAFVVILVPITAQYGLGGLLISGVLAGIILVAMGLARLGTLVQLVPYPVVVGFTAGIGVVIATLQLKDLAGLNTGSLGLHYTDNLVLLVKALPSVRWADLSIGLFSLALLILWPKRLRKIPPYLGVLVLGSLGAWLLAQISAGFQVDTIGSRFHYTTVEGIVKHGIPSVLPSFVWPWELPNKSGQAIGISFELVRILLSSAFAIAALGALESLLCATVADGMAGSKHDPNDELIGQGIGNIIVPFFGGIPATAAIARTAANIGAGATSPLSSVVHSLFIVLSILLLAPLLKFIPMATMAAILLRVAWNISEAKHFVRIVRVAPRSDVVTLLVCFMLTVLMDMNVAVAVGMGLAALLFIRHTIELTGAKFIERHEHPHAHAIPAGTILYDVNGPLFFGAAQKALSGLTRVRSDIHVVILDLSDVTLIDMTAMVTMETIIRQLKKKGILLIINSLDPRMILKLHRAGVLKEKGVIEFARNLDESCQIAASHHTVS